MKTRFLPALCAGLTLVFGGCDLVGDGDSVLLPVSAIEVDDLPLDAGGEPWDADSGPDILVEVQNAGGAALYRSETLTDVDLGDGPFRFELPAIMAPSPTLPLFISVYETDGDYTTDQLIRTTEAFRVEELTGDVELNDALGRELAVRLEVDGLE